MKKPHIILFCIVTALFWTAQNTMVPILTTYAGELGATAGFAGIIAGSYGFFQLVLRIPLGVASDIYKKRKIFITASFAFCLAGNLLVVLFASKYTLLAARSFSSISASMWIIYTVLFPSYYEPEDAPRVIGFLYFFNSIGSVLGQFAGGLAAQTLGMRFAFALAVIISAVGMILSFGILEKAGDTGNAVGFREVAEVSRDKGLLFVSLLCILLQYIIFAAAFGFTPVIAKTLGATSLELGLLSVCATLPMLFLAPLSGTFFLNKIGVNKSLVLGFAFLAVFTLLVPFCGNLPAVFACQIGSACGRALLLPLLSGLSIKNIEDSKRATATGIFASLYSVGMLLGPVIHGFVGEHMGMSFAFFATGAVAVLAIVIVILKGKKFVF